MKVTPFDIYLISFADKFSETAFWVCIIFLLVAVVCILACGIAKDNEDEEAMVASCKFFKRSFIAFIVCLCVYTVAPNSKTIAAMYLVPAVMNNEHVQNSAGNALGILEELTKQWLQNLTKTNNSNKSEANI